VLILLNADMPILAACSVSDFRRRPVLPLLPLLLNGSLFSGGWGWFLICGLKNKFDSCIFQQSEGMQE
jgi:hypothetical protein